MLTSSPFTIRVRDFNLIFRNKKIISHLRSLTLQPDSGLNNELNDLTTLALNRKVDAKVIMGYYDKRLVAWALLSKEYSSWYSNYWGKMTGALFEVYVKPEYRRKGIGTALIKSAKKHAGPHKLSVCRWDSISHEFYNRVYEDNK